MDQPLSGLKMTNQRVIANSLLWAAAIIASAILKAPPILSLILLPGLAAGYVQATRGAARPCHSRARS
jgi:hypothetical protein